MAASTFSQSATVDSAEKPVDLLLHAAAVHPRPPTEILNPQTLKILDSEYPSIPHPLKLLSTPSQNSDTSKLSLATVQDLERFNTLPNSSPYSLDIPTTLSVAQPASSFYFSTISDLSVTHSNSMSESSGSADVSNQSESYDPESDIDPVVGAILKPQNDLAGSETDIRCFACDTEKIKQCWVHAMRLAKVSRKYIFLAKLL